ncbi:MAG: zinc ribbon domain-containing protein [Proteobacteria bacterium]|nr:zinc ribbon domain-containing protein [Pseudomonadota bacterium]
MSKKILYFLLAGIILLFSGCVEVKELVTIRADGSADSMLSIIVQKEFAALVVPDLERQVKKEAPDAVVTVKEVESGDTAIVSQRTVKNLSELRDDARGYDCKIEKDGTSRTHYIFNGRWHLNDPVPVEVTVKFPGKVDETNGEKIDSQTVRWKFETGAKIWGGRGGVTLTATATATTLPLVVIGIGAGILLLAAVGLGVFCLRRKKSGSTPVASSPAMQTQEDGVFCTECGTQQSATVKFCTSCGHDMGAE